MIKVRGFLSLLFSLILSSLVLAKPAVCVLAPISGTYASLGQRVTDAVRFQIRRAGCGLDVKVFDTKGSVDGAGSAINAVSGDQDCVVAIGGIGDATGAEIAQWANIWNIPLVLLSGSTLKDAMDWVIRLRPSRAKMFQDIGKLCADMKKQRFYVLCPASPFLYQVCQDVKAGATAVGAAPIEVVCKGPKDCAEGLSAQVHEKKGDFLLFTPFPLKETIRALGFLSYLEKRRMFTVVGGPMLDLPSLMLRRAAELDGLIFGDVLVSTMMPALSEQYRRVTGHELSSLEVWAMDSTKFVCKAYMGGASTRQAIKDFFDVTGDFQGLAGNYIKNGMEWDSFIHLFRLKDGSIESMGQ